MRTIELLSDLRAEMTKDWETVTIDMDDDLFLQLAKMAHDRDITINDMIVLALHEVLAEEAIPEKASDEKTVLGAFADMKEPEPSESHSPVVDENGNIWPPYLMIRDTGLHDDLSGGGQRIYTTAGRGYKKKKYVLVGD